MDELKGMNFYDVGPDTFIAYSEEQALEAAKEFTDIEEGEKAALISIEDLHKRVFYNTDTYGPDDIFEMPEEEKEKCKETFYQSALRILKETEGAPKLPIYFCSSLADY